MACCDTCGAILCSVVSVVPDYDIMVLPELHSALAVAAVCCLAMMKSIGIFAILSQYLHVLLYLQGAGAESAGNAGAERLSAAAMPELQSAECGFAVCTVTSGYTLPVLIVGSMM